MARQDIQLEIELKEGVEARIDGRKIYIKGPKGEVSRQLILPNISIEVKDNKIIMTAKKASQREYKLMTTYRAHFRNMIKGVTEGHEYKLKILSSHFPMQVNYKNGVLEIRNFFGEKHPRKLEIPKEVELKIDGQLIILKGIDKELVGNTASLIEKLTRRPNFDPRIFQDGIYIIEKDGKKIV